MIKLQDLTPSVYYDKSRDFQFIGRLYDVVLNSLKTNADMVYAVPSPNAANSRLIDLLALTLGFKAIHNYNVKQLSAICSILPTIMRNKGSLQALKLAGNTLLATADGSKEREEFNCEISPDGTEIEVFIPECDVDITLFNDLLYYILPAGMSCKISRAVRIETATQSAYRTLDEVIAETGIDKDLNMVVKERSSTEESSRIWHEPSEYGKPTGILATSGYMTNSAIAKGIAVLASTESTETANAEEGEE